MQFATHRVCSFRRIDRGCNDARAGCPDLFIVFAVVRQLAKAKGSPVTAIKKEHNRALRSHEGEPLRCSGGIGQFEVRGNVSDGWNFAKSHDSKFDAGAEGSGTGQPLLANSLSGHDQL